MRNFTWNTTALGLALSTVAIMPTLSAQAVVEKQVLEIGLALASEGYELTHELVYEDLSDGEYDFYVVELDKGVDYQIYAVCDEDCSDIDLCLYDGNEKEIACDEVDDDYPIVGVIPKRGGNFEVKVTMHNCDLNPCKFGIVIFGR